MAGSQKLSRFQTSLALLATYTGGGVLGMPYVFYHMGIYYGSLAVLTITVIDAMSSMMLLNANDLIPGRKESIYEISYLLFGRVSIFVYCGSLFVANFGSMVVYYSIFGDMLSHLFKQILVREHAINLDESP